MMEKPFRKRWGFFVLLFSGALVRDVYGFLLFVGIAVRGIVQLYHQQVAPTGLKKEGVEFFYKQDAPLGLGYGKNVSI